MGRIVNAAIGGGMGLIGAGLAYFRILMTFSLCLALGMFLVVIAGYPLDPLDFIIFGGPGVTYYTFQIGRGFVDGRRETAAAE